MTSGTKQVIENNENFHVVQLASGDLWAGAEVMLFNLAKSLQTELEIKTSVILLNHGTLEERLSDCGIDVYVLDESHLNSFQTLQQLNQLVRKLKPDVLHTHRFKENILGSIVAWHNNIPSLRTAHGAPEHRPPIHNLPKHLLLFLDRLLGRRIQKNVIAVSTDLAKKLEQDFPKSKIKVIENGIDIEAIRQNISHNSTEKTASNIHRVGIAGRLTPVKRVDLFIECAYYLNQQHPELDIHFHIYGDGPLQEALQAQVQAHNADAYIHFEGHCDNLTSKLLTLDALVMTSDHEGLPMILLESMSLQIPIIAHAVGGIPHLLEQGKCGTLVHEHTAKAFAAAIKNLMTHRKQYQQLAHKAYERVSLYYSSKHTAQAYRTVYRSLLQR